MAFNREYSAFLSDGHIYTCRLDEPDGEPQYLTTPAKCTSTPALSQPQPQLLAVPCGLQVCVFNVATRRLVHTIAGIGRVITFVTFAPNHAGALATGHIDGTVCIWQVDDPSHPQRRMTSDAGRCRGLAFNPSDESILACLSSELCQVFDLRRDAPQPLCVIPNHGSSPLALIWHRQHSKMLLVSYGNKVLDFYDLSSAISGSKGQQDSDSSDDEDGDGVFGLLDGLPEMLRAAKSLTIDAPLTCMSWCGASTLLGLTTGGVTALLCQLDKDDTLVSTEALQFERAITNVSTRTSPDDITTLCGIGEDGLLCKTIDAFGEVEPSDHASSPSVLPKGTTRYTPKQIAPPASTSPTISPAPISLLQNEHATFARTSRQLQRRRQSRKRSLSTEISPTPRNELPADTKPPAPSIPSMTSSLELPKPRATDDLASPMPFISPSIPSRKVSPNEIPPLAEGAIPMAHMPSLSSLPPTSAAPDLEDDSEDSDDEAFVSNIRDSMLFLPGGINVPLPKACGALFAPNGQLLVFFPPKRKVASSRNEPAAPSPLQKENVTQRMVKLFPTFGALDGDSDSFSDSSLDGSGNSSDEEKTGVHTVGSFARSTLSVPGLASSSPQGHVTPLLHDNEITQASIIVSIHEIDDYQMLSPARRTLAKEYRVLCEKGESGAQLCLHNAGIARRAMEEETAEAWWLLSMLLEDKVPLELPFGLAEESIMVITQKLKSPTGYGAGANITDLPGNSNLFGKLRWAEHPFGGAWLINQIFQWAENRADVQFMAYATAVLSAASETVPLSNVKAEQAMVRQLPMHTLDYFSDVHYKRTPPSLKRRVPTVRTHSATITSYHEKSPSNAKPSSQPSQPATPYLDPDNVPSWFFSPILRQRTQSFVVGPLSPELERSNSFSAIPKGHGHSQSISDKSHSFSTSPTAKRMERNASGNAELSSSLPGGSWLAKSVSFASSAFTNASNGSFASSGSPGHLMEENADGNDSDRTLDDTGTPHTPRTPDAVVSITFNNDSTLFVDEISGSAKAGLVPDGLADKADIWCSYYADMLRSWDMHMQAAELEKAIGLAGSSATGPWPATPVPIELGLQPAFRTNRRQTRCAICESVAKGTVQLCPSCLHVSHLSCLEAYVAAVDGEDDGAFQCPAGCGCECAAIPFVVQELVSVDPPSPPRLLLKKKPSFTDPMRWRTRVAGDSW
ncbi:hypothetical protein BDY17DRAFT_302459 [Neohortaea acidophila]|uniref:RING-type domain-containing protein n=1 Tax=Neohortaea acidophila TaxID=245834 RepID=A0A6A6PN12_9PEZI|nr:uncharacterized protein BDY17DRAFT_302459 [Neohortaea acidophila]KAF2480823.1 hypothetical protein BDY17DRAFT_302459 [Neohortaea acidophila]